MAVGVSGLGVVGTLAPGPPVIRALRATPEFHGAIIGFAHDPLSPVNYDPRLLDRCYLAPYPRQGPAQLLSRITEAHQERPIDAIIPTLDSELPVYIELWPHLESLGVRLLLPSHEKLAQRSKLRLSDVAVHAGLRTPHSVVAYNYEAVLAAAQQFYLPFVVKGNLHGAVVVSAMTQLGAATEQMIAVWGYPVVVQEYVPGLEYDVASLGSRSGKMLGAVPMKKLQLDQAGKAWGGITVDDPELIHAARRIVETLEWPGPLEVELMRHSTTNELYLLEVNPRFPAWIHLAAAAGQNLVWDLVRLIAGEEVKPETGYHTGVMYLRYPVDITCPLAVYESLVMDGKMDHRQPGVGRTEPRWVSIETRS